MKSCALRRKFVEQFHAMFRRTSKGTHTSARSVFRSWVPYSVVGLAVWILYPLLLSPGLRLGVSDRKRSGGGSAEEILEELEDDFADAGVHLVEVRFGAVEVRGEPF